MKEDEKIRKQNGLDKKLLGKLHRSFTNLKRRHKIIVIVLLCMIMGYIYLLLTKPQIDSESQIASHYFIRREAARLVGKEPNDLTDDDFAKITVISLGYMKYHDLTLLEKFTSLQKLSIIDGRMPGADKKVIPKWKAKLAKFGIIDLLYERCFDLKPLEKLSNLRELALSGPLIDDIEPLAKLTNLKKLALDSIQVSELKPIKDLINLRELTIRRSKISNIKPIKHLVNLKYLSLFDISVSDLKPLKNLTELQELKLYRTQVSDLEPLKGLTKLKDISLIDCDNITQEQVDNLYKAIPNLIIQP